MQRLQRHRNCLAPTKFMTPPPAKLRAALDAIDNLEAALEALEPFDALSDPSVRNVDVQLEVLFKHLQRLEQQALNPNAP